MSMEGRGRVLAGAAVVAVGLVAALGLMLMLRRRSAGRKGREDPRSQWSGDSYQTPRSAARRLREELRRSQSGPPEAELSDDPSLEEAPADQAFWDRLARPRSSSSSTTALATPGSSPGSAAPKTNSSHSSPKD